MMDKALLEVKIATNDLRSLNVPPDFGALLIQLQKLLSVLNQMGRGSGKDVGWRVRRISRNSPTTVAVEPVNQEIRRPSPLVRVSDQVFEEFHQVIQGNMAEVDSDVLIAMRDFAKALKASKAHAEITHGTRREIFDQRIIAAIEREIRGTDSILGSVRGKLDAVNIHKKNVCNIYIHSETRKVECLFPDQLLPEVGSAIGKWVEVSGKFIYRKRDNFPYRADITDLRQLPLGGSIFDIVGPVQPVPGALERIREMRDS